RATIDTKLDLAQTDFDLSFIGASKRAGAPGTAELKVDLANGRATGIPRFSIDAQGFAVAGSAKFKGKENGLESLTIERLRSGLTDISIAARSRDDGAYLVDVEGSALDAGQLLNRRRRDRADGGAPPQDIGPLPPIIMRAKVDRIHFAADRYVSNAVAEAEYRDDRWRRFVLNGTVGDGKSAAVRLVPNGTGQALSVVSADAGATLRALDLFDTVIGGTLDIQGTIADDKPETPLQGVATMTNFRVVKAPVMARILSLASFTGIADVLSGETGMAFHKASMPFTYLNEVIGMRDGQAYGSGVGITVSGRFDIRNDRADLRGTLVPAYTLNSLIGRIPVIGPLIVGEKGSGVFAATYSVRGPLNGPEVSVNPLAALTPGFLRGLFSIFDTSPAEGGMNPPAPDNAEVINDSY
ncbi:MAG TPA: AsmA-like C-terminal domain-containing protein, partial [Alphaproteobacteria bacterium]